MTNDWTAEEPVTVAVAEAVAIHLYVVCFVGVHLFFAWERRQFALFIS